MEHRFSWNKCFIIYQTDAAQYSATCRKFKGSQTKNASFAVPIWFTVMV